jgi:ubiquinone/menaquinone biosynthesis C-methylase UbiE
MAKDNHLDDLVDHYTLGLERKRLLRNGLQTLEFDRTLELLLRFLPNPPAAILDVGGGPGVYASVLARAGYKVKIIDVVPLHVREANELAQTTGTSVTACVGDARQLDEESNSWDVVLLLGPLYHLLRRSDRVSAIREAVRVARPSGRILAQVMLRHASLLDGLRRGLLSNPTFRLMVDRALSTGEYRNLESTRHPEWFTTAFFHTRSQFLEELALGGVKVETLLGVEGPGWLFSVLGESAADREVMLFAARAVENDLDALSLSSSAIAVSRPLTSSIARAEVVAEPHNE